AHLRGPQGRARPRSLRRPPLSRLASPRLGRPQLLRVRRRRTRAAFPPLGPKVDGRRRAAARGLSVTSTTASSRSGSPSRDGSPAGCRAAPLATYPGATATGRPASVIRPDTVVL